MTTTSEFNLDTNLVSATKEVHISDMAATTRSNDDVIDEQEAFDIESVAEWVAEWVAEEQVRLQEQYNRNANPVRAVDDTIRIDESAMLYDTVYPVKLSDEITYHVIFTSDGAIEIYEVAP